jgi:hypothetical protein
MSNGHGADTLEATTESFTSVSLHILNVQMARPPRGEIEIRRIFRDSGGDMV